MTENQFSYNQKHIRKKLDFLMETQQMDCWCWLAVGTSIALYYDKDSGWTQCKCLNATIPSLNGVCCDFHSPEVKATCDVTGFLVNQKVEIGSFITLDLVHKNDTATYTKGFFPFETIVKSIDNGQVLAVNVITNEKHQYPNGAWGTFSHFIALIGYEIINGQHYVITADPMYLEQDGINESLMTYENLTTKYDLITYPSSVAYSFYTINKNQKNETS
jgi:hypothetical protein